MIPAGYVQSLVTYAEVKGSSTEIEAEFEALFARMQADEGSQVINTSVNGKSVGLLISMTVEEKFTAFGEALREIKGTRGNVTYAAFSGIQR